MIITPVLLVCSRYADRLKEIQKVSAKWEKRTNGLDPTWPKEGTFDVSVRDDMEDYIPKDISK